MDFIKAKKIILIKEELKKFAVIKRSCKYSFKNWFRTSTPSEAGVIKNGLWKSPKFPEMNDNHYVSVYGKYYITCLHIMYNRLRHEKTIKPHIINVKEDVYKESIKMLDMWLDERANFESGSGRI